MKLFLRIVIVLVWCTSCSGLVAEDSGQRIVAVGDVHGDYDNFFQVLQQAGIINRRGNWIADTTQLVQLGDLPDRGPDTDQAVELLMKLERQAARRGGQVHVLIGNHEAMNMLGDLRYVHPGEYAAFVDRNSERLRDRYFDLVVRQRQASDPEFVVTDQFREQWYGQFPLGYVEHRLAWAPDGEYGSWVLEHDAVVKIDRTLFLHGGIGPDVVGTSLEEINQAVRAELSAGEALQSEQAGLATSDGGPLWYRGLAMNDEDVEADHLEAVLNFYDVDRVVIGHTPLLGAILPRFGGRVLVIDSGISSYYGGHLASLVIEGDRLFTIQRGERLEIPTGDQDLAPYFRRLVELKPEHEPLQSYLEQLTAESP